MPATAAATTTTAANAIDINKWKRISGSTPAPTTNAFNGLVTISNSCHNATQG